MSPRIGLWNTFGTHWLKQWFHSELHFLWCITPQLFSLLSIKSPLQMGLPIPWWPVSLCAVILMSPFKILRQGEMRHATVQTVIPWRWGRRKGNLWACFVSVNGSNIHLELLGTSSPCLQLNSLNKRHFVNRHLWEGNFQRRKCNSSFPRERAFLDSFSRCVSFFITDTLAVIVSTQQ